MTSKHRLSASVDQNRIEMGKQAVARGSAPNLSALVKDALRLKCEHDQRLKALAEFVAEFEFALDQALAGRVRVKFTILEVGTVSTAAVVKNTTCSRRLGMCIAGVVRGMVFHPAPRGGAVTFSYPFDFAPMDAAASRR